MKWIKKSLQVDLTFFIRLGLILLVATGIVSHFNQEQLAQDFMIYAYLALLIGVLAQIWELRFNRSIVLTLNIVSILNREVMLILLVLLLWLAIFIGV